MPIAHYRPSFKSCHGFKSRSIEAILSSLFKINPTLMDSDLRQYFFKFSIFVTGSFLRFRALPAVTAMVIRLVVQIFRFFSPLLTFSSGSGEITPPPPNTKKTRLFFCFCLPLLIFRPAGGHAHGHGHGGQQQVLHKDMKHEAA